MIKFFRKIRQNLITEIKFNKPASPAGRYLIYAIGEIFLVMIGILLALQVNNWNNTRIEISKEQVILKNLEIDFKNNIENLNGALTSFREAYQASVLLLEIIKDDRVMDPDEIDRLIDDIINKTQSFDLITGSINEIFNTGSLHLIRDAALRKQISNWSFYYTDTEDDIVIYRDYLFSFFIPSLTDKVRMRNMSVPKIFEEDLELLEISRSDFNPDYDKNLRTVEFENEVYNNALNYMYVINSYHVFRSYLQETLAIIESNIK
jgi:hypothetical protein